MLGILGTLAVLVNLMVSLMNKIILKIHIHYHYKDHLMQ